MIESIQTPKQSLWLHKNYKRVIWICNIIKSKNEFPSRYSTGNVWAGIPTCFADFDKFMNFFFKIPKIQKSYNILAIFLRVLWWSKRLKWSLKFQKTRFFFKPFSAPEKGLKKRVYCDFKNHFDLFDHQTILKNISRILYEFCIFGIWKKTHKFVKIGKKSGNMLEGIFWYVKIM